MTYIGEALELRDPARIRNRVFDLIGLLGALIALSTAATAYFLFQVPNWCGAVNRNGTLCRDNSSGLLIGCYRRQHKWQKIKPTFVSQYWRRLGGELKSQPLEGVKTVTALLGLFGGLITLCVALVKLAG